MSSANDAAQSVYLPGFPFPGIAPYSYADRNVFFARENEARSLIRLIVQFRGVLVYSDSGTGKSSLINAGLMPLAVAEGFQPERIRVQPRRGEEMVVERLVKEGGDDRTLLPSVFTSDALHKSVVLSAETFLETLRKGTGDVRPLLIFDQFEEWVTLFEESSGGKAADEARASQEKIRDAIVMLINDSKIPVKVVMVFREDYLAKLTPFFQRCPTLPDQYLRLTSLTGEQVYHAIRGPYEKYPGRYLPEIGPGLAKQIQMEFVERSGGSDIRLTEVQIVCQSLFESGKEGPELERFFKEQAGVKGILEKYLERTLTSLATEQQEPTVALLTRMVTSAGTRNVISRDDLLRRVELEDGIAPQLLSETLDNLERNTKLVRRERRREVPFFEIASEFLVDWIQKKAQERQRVADQRKLEEKIREAQRRAEEQYRLEQAQRRAEEQATSARRYRRLAIILAAAVLVMVFFGVVAFWQFRLAKEHLKKAEAARNIAAVAEKKAWEERDKANLARDAAVAAAEEAREARDKANLARDDADKARERHTRLARSGELSAHAIVKLNTDPDLSLLLALEAVSQTYSVKEGVTSQARKALLQAVQNLQSKPSFSLTITFSGHKAEVMAASLSPDGRTLATASADKTAKVWDVASGQESVTLSGHTAGVSGVAFSADGRLLATASADRTAKVWDVASGKELVTLSGHTAGVSGVAFSADGRLLATASVDRTAKMWDVRIWDVASGKEERIFPGKKAEIYFTVFSPDGRYLAAASQDGEVTILDISSGQELVTLSGQKSRVVSVALSPDARYVATASADRTATVWEVATGQVWLMLSGHKSGVSFIAFSPEHRHLATASLDGEVKMWDLASGQELVTLPGHKSSVYGIAFSPDGRQLATACADRTAKLWSIVSQGFSVRASSFTFSPDGRYLATGNLEGEVKLLDARSGQELMALSAHEYLVSAINFSPGGKILASGSSDRSIRLWDVMTRNSLGPPLSGHKAMITSVAFSPDGKILASGSSDGTIWLWDVITRKSVDPPLSGHKGSVTNLAFSPDGRHLGTASLDRTGKIWHVASHRELFTLSEHRGVVYAVAFGPDGKHLATAGSDGSARVWERASGREIVNIPHGMPVRGVAFRPDGARLLTISQDGVVREWKWGEKTFKEEMALAGPPSPVTASGFSADGRWLATTNQYGFLCLYALDIDDLLALAWPRINRPFTDHECKDYHLHPKKYKQRLEAIGLLAQGNKAARNCEVTDAVSSFRKARELDPSLNFNPDTEARNLAAIGLIEKGRSQATAGNVEDAITSLGEALKLAPTLPFNPEAEARNLAARRLVAKGRFLATAGDVREAENNLREAKRLEPSLTLDPEAEARTLAVRGLLIRGERLANEGKVIDARVAYEKAKEIDPEQIPARSWNQLCWFGSLWGKGAEVLGACEEAVTLESENGGYRDSRGVARALTGNLTGAIEDFGYYVVWGREQRRPESSLNKRTAWIQQLKTGRNPFDEATLELLRRSEGGALWVAPVMVPPPIQQFRSR